MTIEAPPRRGPGASIFFMDLIRGVAAQLVVIGHGINVFLPAVYMVPAPGGGLEARPGGIYLQNLAVLIFFYISGYLITATFLKKSQKPAWRLPHFLADRAARIFTPLLPLLLILLVTDNLVFGDHVQTPYVLINAGLDDFARNATMLFDNPLLVRAARWTGQTWLSGSAFGSASQLWTVVIEWWIYVTFGLAAFWLIRRRGNLLLWVGVFGFAIVVPLAAALQQHSGLIIAWIIGMGMCLAHERMRGVRPLLLGTVAALAFAMAATRWALTAYDFYDPLTAGLLGIALFTFMTARESGRKRVLPAVDALVGGMSKISYSLYLVHLSLLFYVAAWAPALVGQAWMLPVVFVLCNLVATLFYFLFERHYPAVRRRMEPWLTRA
jgi:peptidoglycan/LPS O-acetylase OafA/YrhL